MIKKLLNPAVVLIFFLILILGSILHFMYGSSQTSNSHYIIQQYYMVEYLPKWMLIGRSSKYYDIRVGVNYTGKWKKCYRDGAKKYYGEYENGKPIGKHEWWYPNGNKFIVDNYIDGLQHGESIWWHLNGKVKSKKITEKSKPSFYAEWDTAGLLKYKRHYDEKHNFVFSDFYHKEKLMKQVWLDRGEVKYKYRNKDGSIKEKIFFDKNKVFVKRESYENGELIKTELKE